MSMTSDTCNTCHGEGVTGSEHGPLTCTDCAGMGKLPSGLVRTEWRLRELERLTAAAEEARGGLTATSGEQLQDIRWLIAEVRRAHHVLLQILAASDDSDADDATTTRIKFLANEVLGLYPTERQPS